jgi:aspartate aminotransferase
MKFAKRVQNIDISGIRKMFELSNGKGAINLGLGQPDFDTPGHIKRAAIDAINEGFTSYTSNAGIEELREAISEKFMCENKFLVSHDEIIVTSGASEALHLAILSRVEKGDEVLIPDPGFVSFSSITILAEGKPVGVPLGEDMHMDPNDVIERITNKTRVLIINSPSNPTGAVQTSDEIHAFADIADDYDITLISDEAYEHLIYGMEHISPARFSDNVITINATSKTYAMTGWRLGYLASSRGNIEQMLKIHSYIQACAPSISQRAALAALTGPQECVENMRKEFEARRNTVASRLNAIGLDFAFPHGAFYVFPIVPDESSIVKRLMEKGVIVTPGSAFGVHGKDHVRISYAVPRSDLEAGLDVIGSVITDGS